MFRLFPALALLMPAFVLAGFIPPAPPVLVSPRDFTVITGNSMRILAEPGEKGGRLREIRFSLSYKDVVDSVRFPKRTNMFVSLGRDNAPPFECITDLSRIPDQDEGGLIIYLQAVDSAGNVSVLEQGRRQPFLVLDRNPALSQKTFSCRRAKRPVVADGVFSDWQAADSIEFKNGENEIKAFSLWDDGFLYFRVVVKDGNVVADPSGKKGYLEDNLDDLFYAVDYNKYVPIADYDEIEFFFDTKHDHNMVRNLDDVHFLVGPGGAFYGRSYYRPGKISNLWGRSVACAVIRTQSPRGYVIEAVFPWKELKLRPKKGLTMGFDLYNKDIITPGGPGMGVSWSGAARSNDNNPSEWGNLRIVGNSRKATWILWSVLATCACFLAFVFFRRRNAKKLLSDEKTTRRVRWMEEYLAANFSNPDLTLDDVAKNSGLSPKYAGSIFKATKSQSVLQYLNQLRVAKAQELLKNPDLNVTEIAFQVGYNSPDHFAKVFKAQTGLSPLQYRQNRPE